MIYKILKALDSKVEIKEARAHCDVPCGIYDPITAQIAALTVVRMIDLMHKLDGEGDKSSVEFANSMSRYVQVKEEHAEKTKHEIRVIMGDAIKAPHLEKFPELPGLFQEIMQVGSASRQTANRDNGVKLVEKINQFADIFWQIKEIPTKRANAPYAPNLELVYPAL
jgi:nickel superoxide dismutase